jgi:SAM-dependent methyltransferase
MATHTAVQARDAYDALAGAYDALTAGYDHDTWLDRLERLALDYGLRGRTLLDVACGTGKSFLPLLRRGYEVTGCDISPAMIERARLKAPQARLVVADMRALGHLGSFDLVTCLDDALNYVLETGELVAALTGIRANLAPGGIAVFDVNTLRMYGTAFSSDQVTEREGLLIAWQGNGADAEVEPGCLAEVIVHAFSPAGAAWRRSTSVHRQRHWPLEQLSALAEEAGLRPVAVRGQLPGALFEDFVDENRHTKIVVVATRDDPMAHEEVIA